MIELLLLIIIGLMFPFFAVGLFLMIQIVRPSKPPTDTSNLINRLRLVWFAATRQELFVGTFPWLTRDEKDNMR